MKDDRETLAKQPRPEGNSTRDRSLHLQQKSIQIDGVEVTTPAVTAAVTASRNHKTKQRQPPGSNWTSNTSRRGTADTHSVAADGSRVAAVVVITQSLSSSRKAGEILKTIEKHLCPTTLPEE